MNAVTAVMLVFSMLGALDRMFGNRFGLGKQFEKGFMMYGNMALSMIGMIVLSPVLAQWCKPVFSFFADTLHLDPSIVPASLFANDMGGAPLSKAVALDSSIGMFNALVVSSMLGCTVSFTIPYTLGVVKPAQHKELLLGLLCGIVTIPVGCLLAGFTVSLPLGALLLNLLPLVIFSALIAVGLLLSPDKCVRIFSIFGALMKALITLGLALAVLHFLTGIELISGLDTLENGAAVCLNAAAVMSGAFPLIYVLSRLLSKPLKLLGNRFSINETSAMGLFSSLASSEITFQMSDTMDSKGLLLNAAFAVSGAFTFAGHLAFTMAFDAAYIVPMIVGKLVAGILAILVAHMVSKRLLAGK